MKNKILAYSLKVWLTSVLATPLIYVTIYSMAYGIKGNALGLLLNYAYAIGCNTLFSVLSWAVFYFCLAPILKLKTSKQNKQLLFILIGEALIIGTFHLVTTLFPGIDPPDYTFLMVCHCLVVGRCIVYYKLDYGKQREESVVTVF